MRYRHPQFTEVLRSRGYPSHRRTCHPPSGRRQSDECRRHRWVHRDVTLRCFTWQTIRDNYEYSIRAPCYSCLLTRRSQRLSRGAFLIYGELISYGVSDITVKKYVGLGCGLVSLITENLLIHPFVVLRRQCQVNPGSTKYHLIPVTLMPIIVRLHQTQGINTLWKGIGSVLLVRGMTLAVEDLISKLTPWPK